MYKVDHVFKIKGLFKEQSKSYQQNKNTTHIK